MLKLFGELYTIEVGVHRWNNVTYFILDAPVFRKQSKAEPYPPRMDDVASALYCAIPCPRAVADARRLVLQPGDCRDAPPLPGDRHLPRQRCVRVACCVANAAWTTMAPSRHYFCCRASFPSSSASTTPSSKGFGRSATARSSMRSAPRSTCRPMWPSSTFSWAQLSTCYTRPPRTSPCISVRTASPASRTSVRWRTLAGPCLTARRRQAFVGSLSSSVVPVHDRQPRESGSDGPGGARQGAHRYAQDRHRRGVRGRSPRVQAAGAGMGRPGSASRRRAVRETGYGETTDQAASSLSAGGPSKRAST